jgi:hypothetical protein
MASGATDATRPVLYVGQTQVLTPPAALPLSFEIQAASSTMLLRSSAAAAGARAR